MNDEPNQQPSKEEEYLAGWKRALADYDNLKKDLAREKETSLRLVKMKCAASLLPILDNLERALLHAPKEEAVAAWVKGVQGIHEQFKQTVKIDLGLEPFGKVGEPFDPSKHEAVSEATQEEIPDQAIVQVVQSGWKMGEWIVRPAHVIVNNTKK